MGPGAGDPRFGVSRWILVVGALALGTPVVSTAQSFDATGTWVVNRELSENLREKAEEQAARRRRMASVSEGDGITRSSRGSGRAGLLAAGAGGGARRPGGGGFEAFGLLRRLVQGTDRLQIEHSDPALTIVDQRGAQRVLYTDGRKQENEAGEETVKITTQWKKDRIVSKANVSDGTRVTETYELDSEERLHVTINVGRMALERVYDRDTNEAAAN